MTFHMFVDRNFQSAAPSALGIAVQSSPGLTAGPIYCRPFGPEQHDPVDAYCHGPVGADPSQVPELPLVYKGVGNALAMKDARSNQP